MLFVTTEGLLHFFILSQAVMFICIHAGKQIAATAPT